MMANIALIRSAFVILLIMIQLLAFVSASEDADDEDDSFFTTRRLYADLLGELDGAHLRMSASQVPIYCYEPFINH